MKVENGPEEEGVVDSWAKWMLKLYPKMWRQRYEIEMLALLDEHQVSWRTLLDLTRGAARAQLFWQRRGIWRIQFLVGFAFVSFLCFATYAGVQQYMRQGANFPQESIVTQAVAGLSASSGQAAQSAAQVIPPYQVNVKRSLLPFVIVYDKQGDPIASNVVLNGKTPELPLGVLGYTRAHGVDRLTWQPQPDARIAAVIQYYSGNGGGYVLSGRGLRLVENGESELLHVIAITWASLIAALGLVLVANRRRYRDQRGSTTP